jgi:nucleoside 2-deoxyribosyltransferase
MKKVFLSTSFSGKVDPQSREVLPVFRAAIERVLAGLRKDDMAEVFCAVEDEAWMISNDIPPEIGVKKDIEMVANTDVLVALVESKISAGVQFEIGYAVALGKHVILAHKATEPIAYFNQGAVGAGYMTQLGYDDFDSLLVQLTVAIHAPDDNVPTA